MEEALSCSFCRSAVRDDPYALCTFCADHIPQSGFANDTTLTVKEFYRLLATYHNTARVTGLDLARIMNIKIFGEEA